MSSTTQTKALILSFSHRPISVAAITRHQHLQSIM
ncbi:hypothetical protein CGMCC3_g10952 [Colletotrichum fructicola]|nr:uncharacterized protein CGMCC3_g10952 [Colletotrichum fructicola]KAE9572903.1 hypothetical protein CGMCC3_g10952 [Colletotrichum fructicola]